MSAACPRRYVTVAGQCLRVFCHDGAAEADGTPALLLIHGAGGSYLHWPPHLRRLPGVDVVALDLPGHGDSEGPGRSSIAAYVDVVRETAEALGLGLPVVAGHSMGAAIALEYVRCYPESASGVGVLAGGVRLPVPADLIAELRADFARATERIVDGAYAGRTTPRLRETLLKRLRANKPETLIGDYLACEAFDAAPLAAQVKAPALIISGEQDQTVPLELGAALHRLLAHSELHVLEEAGHMVMLEQPERVKRLLADFVARVSTQPGDRLVS